MQWCFPSQLGMSNIKRNLIVALYSLLSLIFHILWGHHNQRLVPQIKTSMNTFLKQCSVLMNLQDFSSPKILAHHKFTSQKTHIQTTHTMKVHSSFTITPYIHPTSIHPSIPIHVVIACLPSFPSPQTGACAGQCGAS